jgi:hypothetical protein
LLQFSRLFKAAMTTLLQDRAPTLEKLTVCRLYLHIRRNL